MALSKSENTLVPCNTLRLGVALNMSVFQYEILNNISKATAVAKKAYHKIEEELPNMTNGVGTKINQKD